jgi:hypothetical protein
VSLGTQGDQGLQKDNVRIDSEVKHIIHEKEILCANHLYHSCRPTSALSGPCRSRSQEGGAAGAPCCNCENNKTMLEYEKSKYNMIHGTKTTNKCMEYISNTYFNLCMYLSNLRTTMTPVSCF